jgi:hypothetical protein
MSGQPALDAWVCPPAEGHDYADVSAALHAVAEYWDCPANLGWLYCSRPAGHPGRHVAVGYDEMCAAWPGTHPVTLADLDPAPVTP